MKKIIQFAMALVALVALAACSKNIKTLTNEIDNPNYFEKGQIVTLSIGTTGQTKVTSTANSTTGEVSFKWQTNDAIKVTVGTESSTFIVSKLINGGASAEFTGTMPESGSTFDVQFPVNDPDLTTQVYSATEAIPHNMMKFTASGCSLGTAFTLDAKYAVLKLNLYGLDRKVSKIEVNISSGSTHTLNVEEPVKIGNTKATATPFFMVMPTGNYPFTATIAVEEVSPSVDNTVHYIDKGDKGVGTVSTFHNCLNGTSTKAFTAGQVLDMPARLLTIVWAPVNCGTDADHPWGLLYQWGRKDGQGYYDATLSPNETAPTIAEVFEGTNGVYTGSNPLSATTFYKAGSTGMNFMYDWIKSGSNDFWHKTESPDNAYREGIIIPIKGDFDPCPDGWRVPNNDEMNALYGGKTGGYLEKGNHGTLTDINGKYFNGTSSCSSSTLGTKIFLPAAGYRDDENGKAYNRGMSGHYLSSIENGDYVIKLAFDNNMTNKIGSNRANGCSVRCVQEYE